MKHECFRHWRRGFLLLLATGFLGGSAVLHAAAMRVTPRKPEPRRVKVTDDGLEGKTLAPISIEYDLPAAIHPGDEPLVNVQVIPTVDMAVLDVTIEPEQGVLLLSTQTSAHFLNAPQGEARTIPVVVRLTDPHVGYFSVLAQGVDSDGRSWQRVISIPIGNPPPKPPKEVGINEDLSDLILVIAAGDKAVVRFGASPTEYVSAGDLLSHTKAVLTEIGEDFIVLEETKTDDQGVDHKFRITIHNDEKGGVRVPLP